MIWRVILGAAVAGFVGLASTGTASAVSSTDAGPTQAPGLSSEQLAAISSFQSRATVSAAPAVRSLTARSEATGLVSPRYNTATRRASFYRGSALMWTRDNVDFGFNWSRVVYSSGYQQAGWIWPNISRNGGITRYEASTWTHRWRALDTIGAGIPTPWGDVKVYSSDYTHRLRVHGDGAWAAWSD